MTVNESQSDGIRVLPPQQIAANVRRLVEESREFLVLVSPYFKPWPQMQQEIERAAKRGVLVRLVVREDHVKDATAHLAPCHDSGVVVHSLMRLHAKLYVTENTAILTSMNLIDASAQESWEAGVLVDAAKAPSVYQRLRDQAADCVSESTEIKAPGQSRRRRKEDAGAAANVAAKGSCIRCASSIRRDVGRPLCTACYGKWKQYGNADYAEKHCHACGKDVETSVAKPLCKPCYVAANR